MAESAAAVRQHLSRRLGLCGFVARHLRLVRQFQHENGWRVLLARLLRMSLLFTTTHGWFRQIRALSNRPELRGLKELQPRLPYKYMGPNYLALGLDARTRARFFLHHYRFLVDTFRADCLPRILFHGVELWRRTVGTNSYAIGLLFANNREGELSLVFSAGGTRIFTLSFIFVPGWSRGQGGENSLLISHMQGDCGSFGLIRQATKDLNELTPQMILFHAALALAESSRIRQVLCVGAASQPSFAPGPAERLAGLLAAYDGFLDSIGAERLPGNFYRMPVPPTEKPLSAIPSGRRRRTRLKREFRKQIADEVRGAAQRLQAGTAEP
jgi:uncharacterized protein VirK/YbjX